MVPVKLPDIPEGEYLEDYVAAYLQCGGFYTEKSLTETQVMELDIVAWKPTNQPIKHELFEVKGGRWGFSDIFKVYGWKTYLKPRGVEAAYMIVSRQERTDRQVEYARDKCKGIGLELIVIDNHLALEKSLNELKLTAPKVDALDHSMWRFSFWLERKIQQVVTNSRKSQPEKQGPTEVYKYQELVRNGLVQARDARERLAVLYKAHLDHRTLAKSVAAELGGGEWDTDNPPDGKCWQDAMYRCKHKLVQAVMYHEHRARLDILKGAVEFALLDQHGIERPQGRIAKFLDFEIPADILPNNFNNTVEELKGISGFENAATVWQSFLWKWGGLFLVDQQEEEKLALANEVGLSVKSVNAMLGLYDTLFPTPKGWFFESNGTKILKLFPCQFRGIGARYRFQRMGINNEDDLEQAFGSDSFLPKDLIRWNNSAVALLRGDPE